MKNNISYQDSTIREVSKTDSKFLASVIVSYRILGVNKKLAQEAMSELASRRLRGESFPFESWISEQVENFNAAKKL